MGMAPLPFCAGLEQYKRQATDLVKAYRSVRGQLAFDYHGYSNWLELFAHMKRKANRWWMGC